MSRYLTRALMSGVVLFARFEARVLPAAWLHAMGRFSARALVRCSARTRQALIANGRRLLGADADEVRLRAFAVGVLTSFSRFFIELLRAPRDFPDRDELLQTMRGREHGERVLAMRRGVIGVTLHLGNYELASVLSERFQPAAVVYRPDPNGLFERLRSKTRGFANVGEIKTDRPMFGVAVLDLLRRGGAVFVAGDIGFAGEAVGEPFPFLGGRAHFHTWIARLSIASGAPILPCFVVPDASDGAYRVQLEAPILPGEAGDADAIMRELVAVFERYVREYPEQWLILHRYWSE